MVRRGSEDSPTDNLWTYDGWGESGRDIGGYCFYSYGSNDENCPELKTTVSGLPQGTYKVYAVYWTSQAQNFTMGIQAGLTSNNLKLCNDTNGSYMGSNVCSNGGYEQRRACLGTVTGTGFTVYVDDIQTSGVFGLRNSL